MPEFMFEKINQKHDIKIDLRCEIFSVSNFISDNKLTTFSSIYYKETININKMMTDDDLDDFETFCKINRNLKLIEMNYYFIGDIKKIVELLKKNNVRNIKIQITTNDKNFNSVEESITYLKTLNKRLKKSHNIRIKIKYTNEYKKEKEIKQYNLNYLKLCGFILIMISIATIGFLAYNNFTQTEAKLKKDNIDDEYDACITHYNVGKTVKKAIQELGDNMPDTLPTKEKFIKELEREELQRIETN